jgi:glycosyltransferase involved in cell wall biosynthesis
MRVLMVSDFYFPTIGGAERQVQLLSEHLTRRGHEISVATVWQDGLNTTENSGGVSIHRLKGLTTRVPWFSKDPIRRFHPPFPDPEIVLGLRSLTNRLKPQVVHAQGWIAYSCAAALLGKRIPLLISARDYGYICPTRTLMWRGALCTGPAPAKCLGCAAERYGKPKGVAAALTVLSGRALLAGAVSAAHSVSTFVQQVIQRDLLAKQVDRSKSRLLPDEVIPSFLDWPREGDVDSSFLKQLPDRPFILFVGALQPHKGLDPLLNAYRRLANRPPLVLIGSVWPDTPTEFPNDVTVLRDVAHQKVMAAWNRCLFGVTPSVWPDPLPAVVREGMVSGKAMVGTAVGGIVDMIIDGETGLLVPPGDVEALASAMQRLIESPDLRERLGRASRERAQMFAPEAVVPRFEQLYTQLGAGRE